MKQKERDESAVWLTHDEALGLLDMLLLVPGDLTQAQRTALLKISDHCRRQYRETDEIGSHPTPETRAAHSYAA